MRVREKVCESWGCSQSKNDEREDERASWMHILSIVKFFIWFNNKSTLKSKNKGFRHRRYQLLSAE